MNFANEFITLALQVPNFAFPKKLESEIWEALDDPERRCDTVLQIMTFATFTSRDIPEKIEWISGKFLYVNYSKTCLVWGKQEFQAAEGFKIGNVLMIGGRPCWVEYSKEQTEVCVVWGGERGQHYPEIVHFQEIDNKPCYRVRMGFALRDPDDNYERNEEFVVWGTQEGIHYEYVRNLVNIEEKPCYTACSIVEKHTEVFVWGTQEVAEGPADYGIGKALPWDNGVVFLVPIADEKNSNLSNRTRLFHASSIGGIELIAEADHIGYPVIVDGQLAYNTQNHEGTEVVVVWGKNRFVHVGELRPWLALDLDDDKLQQTPPLLVFGLETPDGKWSLWVNLQKVCEWERLELFKCTFDEGTGVMTRERIFEPFEAKSFNLRELGIIS
ncbi:MAG: hypothetical protein UT30_C0013G0006 [Candidatus Uhrbacteria bacterium GW2011_GWF2_39_13]|uniref:Uncharacterized protein n=1 Tax=Candidatus Uhrbacteria bacterium GW2011_GWF2_39_13 TaxID=1618995 RepID=A0A0G0Q0W6_9BACT|nr:MAG: hypothetical protein UT30_C0013G0006 [Candidatus Uhrbacteria bacterium GW2011_GWF2_39_13]HAU66215.1 hypothetical protein [Candidatus Uhrbacteria bacterium]